MACNSRRLTHSRLCADTVLRANMLSDDRVDTKRRALRMAEEQKEAELMYRLEAVCEDNR